MTRYLIQNCIITKKMLFYSWQKEFVFPLQNGKGPDFRSFSYYINEIIIYIIFPFSPIEYPIKFIIRVYILELLQNFGQYNFAFFSRIKELIKKQATFLLEQLFVGLLFFIFVSTKLHKDKFKN